MPLGIHSLVGNLREIAMFSTVRMTFAAGLFALPVSASDTASLDQLMTTMGLPNMIELMQQEGLGYGDDLEAELFPDRGGASWDAVVAGIYGIDGMYGTVRDVLAERLDENDIEVLTEFFGSERGQRIVSLEVGARREMMSDDIEAAAIEAYQTLRDEGGTRFEQLETFAQLNDLVESNVMGAMNANYAFYTGLIDGEAFGDDLSEEQVLTDVWSQEDEIRADSTEWVFAFLTLAYQPLSDEDLDAYIALSETKAGEALNSALFAAFDDMYVGISRSLGLAASRFMVGQDI